MVFQFQILSCNLSTDRLLILTWYGINDNLTYLVDDQACNYSMHCLTGDGIPQETVQVFFLNYPLSFHFQISLAWTEVGRSAGPMNLDAGVLSVQACLP